MLYLLKWKYPEQSTNDESLAYTTKGQDATGLYYFNARYYDPTLGRFISEDPAKDGSKWYVYCANNPLKYVDQSGMMATMSSCVGGGMNYSPWWEPSQPLYPAYYGPEMWEGNCETVPWYEDPVTLVSFTASGGLKASYNALKAGAIVLYDKIALLFGYIHGCRIGTTTEVGTLVKHPGIKVNWDLLIDHGFKRMIERGMKEEIVNFVVEKGVAFQQTVRTWLFFHPNGVVVVSEEGRLITTYSSEYFDDVIEKVLKMFNF